MNEPDVESLFRDLPEIEPSATFLRRVRTIPLEHPRSPAWTLFSWPLRRTVSALSLALAFGLALGSFTPESISPDSDLDLFIESDSTDLIALYGEFE